MKFVTGAFSFGRNGIPTNSGSYPANPLYVNIFQRSDETFHGIGVAKCVPVVD